MRRLSQLTKYVIQNFKNFQNITSTFYFVVVREEKGPSEETPRGTKQTGNK